MKTVCINCGQPRPKTAPCPSCHAPSQQQVRAARNTHAWRQHSRAQRDAHPVCVDCGAAEDLTSDHLLALALGGAINGKTVTRCRSCNSSRKTG